MLKNPLPINRPEPIKLHHILNEFDCGNESLNRWLVRRAVNNEGQGSRTYVVVDECYRVVGYYAIALGGIEHKNSSSKIKRNMPDPVPAMILGRLGVDKNWQGKNIGSGMLKDAVLKTVEVSKIAGIRAMLVHAISEEAKLFYMNFGFHESPVDKMTLMITLDEAKNALLNT